jgi:hypothetical protein
MDSRTRDLITRVHAGGDEGMTQQAVRKSIVWGEDPFSGPREVPLSGHARLSPDRMLAYAQALEQRCNVLWAYLQGHAVAIDPVIGFLADEFAITEAGEPDLDVVTMLGE